MRSAARARVMARCASRASRQHKAAAARAAREVTRRKIGRQAACGDGVEVRSVRQAGVNEPYGRQEARKPQRYAI